MVGPTTDIDLSPQRLVTARPRTNETCSCLFQTGGLMVLAGFLVLAFTVPVLAVDRSPRSRTSVKLADRLTGSANKPLQCAPCCLRPQDEIWLVSTRHLGACPSEDRLRNCCLEVFRYGKCGWEQSSEAQFFGSDDPCVLTTVYVHGNRVDRSWAQSRGFGMYDRVVCGMPCDRPLRHVIWSWPGDKVDGGPKYDAQVKASRTPRQSYLLAAFLAKVHPNVPVSLIGYSYGARTIAGALHLLGGGTLSGRRLACCGPVVQTRAVLLAPAMENDWLNLGNCNGCAMASVDRLLILYNSTDRVLRRYQRGLDEANSHALGYTGIPNMNCVGNAACRICQLDAARQVGRQHDWDHYADCACLMNQLRNCACWK